MSKFEFGGGFTMYEHDRLCVSNYPCENDVKLYSCNECDEAVDALSERNIYITKVFYRNPATIVMWSDGTKTMSKCHGGDIYSPETGLVMCVLKKLTSGSQVRNLIHDWVTDECYEKNTTIDLHKVRQNQKNSQKLEQ